MVCIPYRSKTSIESMTSLLKGIRIRRESHSNLLQHFVIKLLNFKLFLNGKKREKRLNS